MAENEKVLTDKTAKELIKSNIDLTLATNNLRGVTSTATDIMKKTGKKPSSSEISTVGADGTPKFMKKTDLAGEYYKKSIATLKDILKVNKEMLANSVKNFGKGLGSLLALGGLLGFIFTGKVELLYATIKGFEKGFILPIAKIMDKFIMKFAKNMLKEGMTLGKAFKGVFDSIGGMAKNLLKKLIPAPITKAVSALGKKMGIVKKVATPMMKTVWRTADGKLAKEGAKGAVKGTMKMSAKEVAKATAKKLAVEGAEGLGTAVAKKGASALVKKGGGKLGLKALAKIPILGTILGPVLGLVFAFQRWKKGDYVGALLEVGSGLASMIPFLGIPISLAIDVFMAFRDLKTSEATVAKRKENAPSKKIQDAILDGVPVIGTLRAINRMKKKWAKKNYTGAIMEAGLAFGSIIPGFGTGIAFVKGIVDSFALQKASEENPTMPTVKQPPVKAPVVTSPAKPTTPAVPTVTQPPITSPAKPTTPAVPTVTQTAVKKKLVVHLDPSKPNPNFSESANNISKRSSGRYPITTQEQSKGDADIESVQSPIKSTVKNANKFKPKAYSVPTSPESFMATSKIVAKKVVKNVKELIKNPFYFYNNSTLKGTLPKVEDNFTKMAQEYATITGTPLQVNSGYRGYQEQKALYELYKSQGREKYASNPDDPVTGKPKKPTSHMAGKAIDINSGSADFLEESGLLSKYSFYRPLMQLAGQPQNIKEPWHLQAKPSLIGDAPTDLSVKNSEAISSEKHSANMGMVSSSSDDKVYEAIRELIEVTKESNKGMQKTMGSQKITNKQSISVNSLG